MLHFHVTTVVLLLLLAWVVYRSARTAADRPRISPRVRFMQGGMTVLLLLILSAARSETWGAEALGLAAGTVLGFLAVRGVVDSGPSGHGAAGRWHVWLGCALLTLCLLRLGYRAMMWQPADGGFGPLTLWNGLVTDGWTSGLLYAMCAYGVYVLGYLVVKARDRATESDIVVDVVE